MQKYPSNVSNLPSSTATPPVLDADANISIFEAAKGGDIARLNWFITTKGSNSINQRHWWTGDTPLHWAARFANLQTVQWFITHGADLKALNKKNMSILDAVAFYHRGKPEDQQAKLDYLLQQGCKFKCSEFELVCREDITALENMFAAETELLEESAPYLLRFACSTGKIKVVSWLLQKYGSTINEKNGDGTTALLFATRGGHINIVQWLLAQGHVSLSEKDNDYNTALLCAAEVGRLEIVHWLLTQGGAKINEKNRYGFTALLFAGREGHLKILQWLLEKGGANITETDDVGNTVLLLAAINGHLEMLEFLLDQCGASITESDNNGTTALIFAAQRGHLNIVQYLLKKDPALIIETNNLGLTAFLQATKYDNFEIVQWLLEHGGANITETDKDGNNALMLAAENGHHQMAQWLLEKGCSINKKNKYDDTALTLATKYGHLEIMQWLLAKDKPNQKFNASCCLEVAVKEDQLEIVRWLFEQDKANITEKDNQGKTAVDIALEFALREENTTIFLYLKLQQSLPTCVDGEVVLDLTDYSRRISTEAWLNFCYEIASLDIKVCIKEGINPESIENFKKILANGKCPGGVQISFGAETDNTLKNLWITYHGKFNNQAIIFAQEKHNKNSLINNLPQELWDKIFQLAGIKKYFDYITAIRPATLFVEKYQPSSFFYKGYRSEESKIFGKKLEQILKDAKNNNKGNDINSAISTFLNTFKNGFKESKALAYLLETYPIWSKVIEKHPEKANYFRLKQ